MEKITKKQLQIKLLKQQIKYNEATAETFEELIKIEGLTMINIALITAYYKEDLKNYSLKVEELLF